MISAGFDAAVVEKIARGRRGPITMARYVPAITSVLGRSFGPFRVVADGELLTDKAIYSLVTNTHSYGGPFTMVPRASSFDGWLDVLTYEGSLARLPLLMLGMMRGKLSSTRGVREVRAKRVLVESTSPVPVQGDGELFGETPLDVEIITSGLKLVVPARAGERHT
jgi:diacylglycerol kinase family enzyme